MDRLSQSPDDMDLGAPFSVRATSMLWGAFGMTLLFYGLQGLGLKWYRFGFVPYLLIVSAVVCIAVSYAFMKTRPWALSAAFSGGALVTTAVTAWFFVSCFYGLFSLLGFLALLMGPAAMLMSFISRPILKNLFKRRTELAGDDVDFSF